MRNPMKCQPVDIGVAKLLIMITYIMQINRSINEKSGNEEKKDEKSFCFVFTWKFLVFPY